MLVAERSRRDDRLVRAVLVSISIAALTAGSVLVVDGGQAPVRFRSLLHSAGPGTELVWPSGPRGAASAGGVLAPTTSHALAVVRTFAGSSSADTSGDPPDPVIGVGAGFVVQMVNSAVRVWTTDGSGLAVYPLATFMGTASADVSDPGVVYDPGSGRWFASAVDVARASVQVAVSTSSDPTRPWTVYSHASGSCPDQPSLGVTSRLVVVGYGAFTAPCRSDPAPTYLGGALLTYDKQALLEGSAQAADWGPRLDLSPVAAVSAAAGTARAVALALPPSSGGRPTSRSSASSRPRQSPGCRSDRSRRRRRRRNPGRPSRSRPTTCASSPPSSWAGRSGWRETTAASRIATESSARACGSSP